MDALLIDDIARKLSRSLGRRRVVATLLAGAGAAATGWTPTTTDRGGAVLRQLRRNLQLLL